MSQLGRSALWMGGMALVALGLGLYAWKGVQEPEAKAKAQKEAEGQLVSFGPDAGRVAFTQVIIESRGSATTLTLQENGAWRITAPVQATADAFQVDSLMSQLDAGRIVHLVDEAPTPEALARYGLDAPQFVIRATAKTPGGGEPTTFVLKGGGENTFDGSSYVQRGDDPKVYAVPGGVRWGLDKSTFDLRTKEVMRVERPVSVEVKAPRHAFTVERQGENAEAQWRLLVGTPPSPLAADKQAVEGFIKGLRKQLALAFLEDSPQERARVGMDAPIATLVGRMETGEPVRLSVSQREEDGEVRTWLLRTDGRDVVLAQMEEGALSALDVDPATLRDRSVLSFDKAKVAKLVFEDQGKPRIVVERVPSAADGKGEDWRVLEPQPGPAKKFKLSSILWSLGSIRASEYLDERPKDWAKWGLDAPARKVTLLGAGDTPLATLAVGAEVPGKENTRYARGSRGGLVEIETGRLEDLPNSPADVLDAPAPAAAAEGESAAAKTP